MADGATIVVGRRRRGYRDFIRAYKVMVDGEARAAIRRGKTVEIPVSAGKHAVKLKLDWCSSPELTLDLEPGAAARLYCFPNTPDMADANWAEAPDRLGAMAGYSILAVVTGTDTYLGLRPVPADVAFEDLEAG